MAKLQYMSMSIEDEIKSVIEKSRKVSQDGSLVTYDLTAGVDFSNPKAVAKALSQVFFEKDALNWFKVNDDKIDFVPTYKVRIVMKEEHNKKLESTVDDFMKDLKKEDVSRDFSRQIKDDAENAINLQSAITTSALQSTLFHHSLDKVYSDEIKDDLFVDLLEKLEIRSLNNDDLMDWKKLPL
jgi:hypothetical protein